MTDLIWSKQYIQHIKYRCNLGGIVSLQGNKYCNIVSYVCSSSFPEHMIIFIQNYKYTIVLLNVQSDYYKMYLS